MLCSGWEDDMPRTQTPKRDALNLRIKPEDRGLIDRAAAITEKTHTDFMLEAARHAAEEASLDRSVFVVTPDTYAIFLARFDETPEPNERLRRTMRTVPPWA